MSVNPRTRLSSQNIVAFLGEIFERRGDEEYLGEPVTMAEHMLQSAWFAEQAGEPDIVVIAALLHDIGHFTSEFGMFSMEDTEDRFHEEAGAEILFEFSPIWSPIVYAITWQPRDICAPQTQSISASCLMHPFILSTFREAP